MNTPLTSRRRFLHCLGWAAGGYYAAPAWAAGSRGFPSESVVFAMSSEPPITTFYSGPEGRILVADSLTYFTREATGRDVVLGASFAGVPTAAVPLQRGVKAFIAHDGGVGRDQAGISGLALAQEFGIPAAAVATFSARLSVGASLLRGTISYANAAAAARGVRAGQTGEAAARLLLQAPAGRPAPTAAATVDTTIHHVATGPAPGAHRVYAAWSLSLVKEPHPHDVFCVASHGARVMAEYAQMARPKGIIANDAGFGLNQSGIDGLPVLNEQGIRAATVSTFSARLGDALSTYHEGIISAANPLAQAQGVRVGMPAREAAMLMLS